MLYDLVPIFIDVSVELITLPKFAPYFPSSCPPIPTANLKISIGFFLLVKIKH